MPTPVFGSHGLAKELAASKRAFLMMTKRSTYGVTWAGEQVEDGGRRCALLRI